MQLSKTDQRRYHRQIFLPSIGLAGMDQLLQAKVLIIGVGGLGSTVAQFLCGAGVGTLTLVDFDCVDMSNLHRQVLYREEDVGRLKVDAAKDNLSAQNSDVAINSIAGELDDLELAKQIEHHDVVIDCTDNLDIRNRLSTLAWRHCKPLVSGSAIRLEGQLFTQLNGDDNPCYHCLSTQFSQPSLSCVENGVLGPVVGVIGNMQALEAIKLICQVGQPQPNRLSLFDAVSGEWAYFKLKKSANCQNCNS